MIIVVSANFGIAFPSWGNKCRDRWQLDGRPYSHCFCQGTDTFHPCWRFVASYSCQYWAHRPHHVWQIQTWPKILPSCQTKASSFDMLSTWYNGPWHNSISLHVCLAQCRKVANQCIIQPQVCHYPLCWSLKQSFLTRIIPGACIHLMNWNETG